MKLKLIVLGAQETISTDLGTARQRRSHDVRWKEVAAGPEDAVAQPSCSVTPVTDLAAGEADNRG
jgi:hypothetical protein